MPGKAGRSGAKYPEHPLDLRISAIADRDLPVAERLIIALPTDGLSASQRKKCADLLGLETAAAIDPEGDPPEQVRFLAADDNLFAQGAAAANELAKTGPADIYLPAATADQVRRFTIGLVRGSQRFSTDKDPITTELFLDRPTTVPAAEQGRTIGQRVLLARRWGNEPSNVKDPQWLAGQAVELAGQGLRVSVWDQDELQRRGFTGLTTVGAGSASPPLLVTMDYRGAAGDPVVLVGKGITFDTGGLSLKPAAGMPLMKTDMTGAAAVMGAMAAIRDLRLPIRVVGILAVAENMPSGTAMRPGDVIRHYGGRSTEILNTDAEGRLVLADCLAYAAARLKPRYLVDLASLTGAATLGLGRQHAALYGTDERLLRGLESAGEASGDAVWRMPLVPDYRAAIESTVADAANTNTLPGISAGSITAALFLQPFAGDTPWAHLDIAGAARADADRPDTKRGATGFGVSLLTSWLTALAKSG